MTDRLHGTLVISNDNQLINTAVRTRGCQRRLLVRSSVNLWMSGRVAVIIACIIVSTPLIDAFSFTSNANDCFASVSRRGIFFSHLTESPPFLSSTSCITRLSSTSRTTFTTRKVSNSSKNRNSGSSLDRLNRERKRVAGRIGTKTFVDPNKLFVGNLPYTATESQILSWLRLHLGMENVVSFKLIRDWRTGQSKGYGFLEFVDPMFATCALQTIKGKMLNGRIITFDQGVRKPNPSADNKNGKKKNQDEKRNKLEVDNSTDKGGGNLFVSNGSNNSNHEEDGIFPAEDGLDNIKDDDFRFFDNDGDSSGDDKDVEYDRVFDEEIHGTIKREDSMDDDKSKSMMNRKQRRQAALPQKKGKRPSKGFSFIPGQKDPPITEK